MDIFNFRNNLMRGYEDFVRSFIKINDKRLCDFVDGEIDKGFLFPSPLIQLNPSYAGGGGISDLVNDGILHPECENIFRRGKEGGNFTEKGTEIKLHKHQEQAIRIASEGKSYVLTTGTGSGKSLTYIIPIVDHILKNGSGKGIKAIIVYPMNALANSQIGELEKFINYGYPDDKGPVTFARYTGQEDDEAKEKILSNPPDILLTNYVMLELILTRPNEKHIVKSAADLKFLVFDELHTYRGRMGSDVALLARRAREYFNRDSLQFVGTSATLSGYDSSLIEQKSETAYVASKIFGTNIEAESVIVEILERSTPNYNYQEQKNLDSLIKRVSEIDYVPSLDWESFVNDPLSSWIESVFGIEVDNKSNELKRAIPKSIRGSNGSAEMLSSLTGLEMELCAKQIENHLLNSYSCEPNPVNGFPIFAFRLHQFISRGDTVYSTLEDHADRYLTINQQQYVPKDRERILFPLVFCRECGQDYYCVKGLSENGESIERFIKRDLQDRTGKENEEPGFLYKNNTNPWPEVFDEVIERLPDDWLDYKIDRTSLKKDYKKILPRSLEVNKLGVCEKGGQQFTFIKAPFRFCLNCGVAYGAREKSDFGKLATLGTEGRSSATSLLALSAIEELRQQDTISDKAKKLLSFTDNRQDASLQAGHFNDFVEVGLLRSALYKATSLSGSEGLLYDDLIQSVFDALHLKMEYYAQEPDARYQAKLDTERALKTVIGYRLYRDLARGWRLTSPNLEQCGLLKIEYVCLSDLCENDDDWKETHPVINEADVELRREISKTLLDYVRRELAIKVDYLEVNFQDKMNQRSSQRLISPWALDENEKLVHSKTVFPRPKKKTDSGGDLFISGRSRFGQYLKRKLRNSGWVLKTDDIQRIIIDLFETLRVAGLVERTKEKEDDGDVYGYQIPASAIKWCNSDGSKPFYDPIRILKQPENTNSANKFFIDFYSRISETAKGIEAREHTAQVHHELRGIREKSFRDGKLPILFCSPTMELGVDISDLNVVNMRNIPPTPANYAQRSGRAGRSGQPALVFSYSSTFSSHDQYFFKRPERMVAGVVNPPRLDLANEDLLKSHIFSVWLAESGMSLGVTLKDILDTENEDLKLFQNVEDTLRHNLFRLRAKERCERILSTIQNELEQTDWYSDRWLDDVLSSLIREFERACDRWRYLYKSANEQREKYHKRINDQSLTYEERQKAKRLRAEAEAQLNLLMEKKSVVQSDFYSYRYFAAEGFLPGYSFPRLPLSAYIPGKRSKDEFLSRPRFIAIMEFGPRAIVYHEGNRYRIDRIILPIEERDEEGIVPTLSVKICETCGYIHYIDDTSGPDLCEQCGITLPISMESLFKMQNVTTRRVDRINSDEEERLRFGFEILTAYRFAEINGRPSFQTATVVDGLDQPLATLKYGQSATISRINLGWSKRKEENRKGFLLDVDKGEWAKNEYDDDDKNEEGFKERKRVIPYVDDNKNCLIFEPVKPIGVGQMASLQAALKNAIQIEFHLEDSELAAEPLPSRLDRRSILFYEAAEGGAGALRHLVHDPATFPKILVKALEHCHFDIDGNDLGRGPRSQEDCEAACYDCLMSYTNQRDHSILDRKAILETLLEMKEGKVISSPREKSRGDHLKGLINRCDSELEKRWLGLLEKHNLNLPDTSQKVIHSCESKPDFVYSNDFVLIFIDGPAHDYPEQKAKDQNQVECLENLGFRVIRFHHDDDWLSIIRDNRSLFGEIR